MCSSLCARQSALSGHAALCCDECAAACETLPDDKEMAACAKACRNCAKECLEISKMMAKSHSRLRIALVSHRLLVNWPATGVNRNFQCSHVHDDDGASHRGRRYGLSR